MIRIFVRKLLSSAELLSLVEAGTRTNSKLSLHVTPGPGIELGSQWWRASALTSAPSLHPQASLDHFIFHKLSNTVVWSRLCCMSYNTKNVMRNTWNWAILLRQEHYLNDNSERFDKLLDGLGTPPLVTVVRVNTLKTTVHDACQWLQKILEEVCCKENIWRNVSHRNSWGGRGNFYKIL